MLLFGIAGFSLGLPGTATLPLMDRDEPKFSQATWEMMETGQIVIPYFNTGYRFDKPPLTYWWMRLHYHLFGKTEFAARLHSVIASILTAFTIYLLGRFLFSNLSGFLSGLAWLTSLQVLIHSRLAVADMPMLLGVSITMYGCARLLFGKEEPRRFGKYFWVLVFGLAFGFLAKGPVAWIVPGLALLIWRWPIGREAFPWKRLQPVSSLVFALALVALWGVAALIQTEGRYWEIGMGEHVVKRGVSAFNGRVNIPIVYYLGTVILSLLPWSAFFPNIFMSRSALKTIPKQAFLFSWFMAPFLVFSLYATQLPHYIMPGFPGFVLLLFSKPNRQLFDTKFKTRWFWSVVGLMIFVSLLIFTAGILKVFPDPMGPINPLLVKVSGIFALVGIAFPLTVRAIQRQVDRWPVMIAIVICAGMLTHLVTREIRAIHPYMVLKEAGAFRDVKAGKHYLAAGIAEPSWVFYQWDGSAWLLRGRVADGIKTWDDQQLKEGIFMTEEWRIGEKAIFAKFKNQPPPHLRDVREMVEAKFENGDYEIIKGSGLNLARTSWVNFWYVREKN